MINNKLWKRFEYLEVNIMTCFPRVIFEQSSLSMNLKALKTPQQSDIVSIVTNISWLSLKPNKLQYLQ